MCWKLLLKLTGVEILAVLLVSILCFSNREVGEAIWCLSTIIGIVAQLGFLCFAFILVKFFPDLWRNIKCAFAKRPIPLGVLLLLLVAALVCLVIYIYSTQTSLDLSLGSDLLNIYLIYYLLYLFPFLLIAIVGMVVSVIPAVKKWIYFIVVTLTCLCMCELLPLGIYHKFSYAMVGRNVFRDHIPFVVFIILIKIVWIWAFWRKTNAQTNDNG